jgi:hypothetical protein
MQLYDDPTTVSAPPALPTAGTPGYFTDGVVGSVARTIIRGWWLNLVQSELVAIVVAGGITPARNVTNQVLTAIQALITDALAAYLPLAGVTAAVEGVGDTRYLRATPDGVTPGEYDNASVTVNEYGQVTAIAANEVPSGATRYTAITDGGGIAGGGAISTGATTLQTLNVTGHNGRADTRASVGVANTTGAWLGGSVTITQLVGGVSTLLEAYSFYAPPNRTLSLDAFGTGTPFTGSGQIIVTITPESAGLTLVGCYTKLTENF